VDRHDKAKRKSEIGKEAEKLDGLGIFVLIAITGLAPFKRLARTARAPNIRIDTGIVPRGVDRAEFRGQRDARTKSSNLLGGLGSSSAKNTP
jgi:hypothetical protein